MNSDKQYDLFIAYHGDATTGSLKEALVVYGAINGRRLAGGRVIRAYLHTEENRFGNFTDTDNIVQRTPLFLLVANERVPRDEYGMLAKYGEDELPKRLYGEVSKFREAQYLKPHSERGDAKVLVCGALGMQDAMRLDSLFSGTVAFRMHDGVAEELLQWIASYFGDAVESHAQAPVEKARVEPQPEPVRVEPPKTEKASAPRVVKQVAPDDDKNYPTLKNYNRNDFEIEGTTLKNFYRHKKSKFDAKIPEGVVTIERSAVCCYEHIPNLVIPTSVLHCEGGFSGPNLLPKITVRKGNPKYHVAGNCLIETATKTLVCAFANPVIPTDGSVTHIGDRAFVNSSLRSLDIPDCITHIGKKAFSSSVLRRVTIPASVVSIGVGAFVNCQFLEEIIVDKGNTNYCVSGKNCLIHRATKTLIAASENSKIPTNGSVTHIGDYVFAGLHNMPSSIDVPEGIVSIGEKAFDGLIYLRELHIPSTVVSIAEGAFSCCPSLERITVAPGNKNYYMDGNCLIDRTTKTIIRGCKDAVIPSDGSVTRIGNNAFDHTELKKINLPKSITGIGNQAFLCCEYLNGVVVPDSVVSIGEEAFYWCFELTDFTLPKRFIQEIGKIVEDTEGVDPAELCIKFV